MARRAVVLRGADGSSAPSLGLRHAAALRIMRFRFAEAARKIGTGRFLGQDTLLQALRYGLSGSAAAATLLLVLVVLTELVGVPSTLASALGFAVAVPVNYALQHRFVFNKSSQHVVFFTRYVTVTLLTLGLNTLLFWLLTSGLGVFYVASQVITIGIIVPLNFVINRGFTFADLATERS